MEHLIKIGHYEIIDAQLDAQNADTIGIPCQTNPELSYQLDGWDVETSVPAWINGEPVVLYVGHYDQAEDRWILKKTA